MHLETAKQVVGDLPGVEALGLGLTEGPDDLKRWVSGAIDRRKSKDGILILVDFPGGTPDNVSRQLAQAGSISVVSGLNLPMVIYALTHRNKILKDVVEGSLLAGREGIRETA